MKNFLPLTSGRRMLVLAFAAIAPVVVGQVSAAPDTKDINSSSSGVSGRVVDGTIPQARPGLPQLAVGAEGPIRSDMRTTSTDPSIRDSNPLTMNGLWEMLPGDKIATHPQ